MQTAIRLLLTCALGALALSDLVAERSAVAFSALSRPAQPSEASVETAASAAELPFASSAAHQRAGVEWQRLAEREQAGDGRVRLLCEALAQYGAGVERAPLDSRLLVQWANVRQLLGDTECGLPLTSAGYQKALDLALVSDPYNPRTLFAAALISRWAGKKTEALDYFNKVLLYDVTVAPEEERTMFTLVETPEDLRRVLPPRFPQVARWSALARDEWGEDAAEGRSTASRLMDELASLQEEAVRESSAALQHGKIPASHHRDRMLQLLDLAARPRIRNLLDRELSSAFEKQGDTLAATYLHERSELQRLSIVRSVLTDDTRPLRRPLTQWASRRTLPFDHFHTTLGFYLPAGQSLRTIELDGGSSDAGSVPTSLVRVYACDDNVRWSEVTSQSKIEAVQIGRRNLLTVTLPAVSQLRYWKVHFDSGARDDRFRGVLPGFLHAYGMTLNEEGELR